MGARADLAAAIVTATTGVQVYDHGADVIALPAAVVQRVDTTPPTLKNYNLEHEIMVHLVTSRATPAEAEDELESIFMDIITALPANTKWTSFSGVSTISVNNVEHIGAQLAITMKE